MYDGIDAVGIDKQVLIKDVTEWKNKKQTAMINLLNLHISWLRLDVSYVIYIHFQK